MDWLTTMEGNFLLFVQENLRFPLLSSVMTFISSLGNTGVFWIVLTLILLIVPRTRRYGVVCAISMILGFVTTNLLLKNIIQRIRPYDVMETLKVLGKVESDFSFPSGHATNSFAAAWALFRIAPKKYGVPALVLAILIALARLYLGAHYPTDVLAGVIIGIVCAEAATRIARKIRKTQKA